MEELPTVIGSSARLHLRTQHLPLLLDQLCQLLLSLDLSLREPHPTFNQALIVLIEMHQSVNQIKSSTASVLQSATPENDSHLRNPPENNTHLGNLETITLYRCFQVALRCKGIVFNLARILGSYISHLRVRLVRALAIAAGRFSDNNQQIPDEVSFQEDIEEYTDRSVRWESNTIKIFIEWLALSNLDAMKVEWKTMVKQSDTILTGLFAFKNTTNHLKNLIIRNQIKGLIPVAKLS
ncbi:hypothetical protein PGT21_016428 [Puccinia graminis f. sp. tritici]|uniref:Uncharacterized protein n=1 Tax=Puccinia graminis f. sp. tritici TaxID=56615 RepID=A0A5B0SFU5_PUCGR|nr:hypothetical protein PGT21_016428 [Puccinia graminis f. sp. tritici]KAA1136113.1 hypothetical protein PGTUg99_031137 [Puccinia graminis f. sp. tritici]